MPFVPYARASSKGSSSSLVDLLPHFDIDLNLKTQTQTTHITHHIKHKPQQTSTMDSGRKDAGDSTF